MLRKLCIIFVFSLYIDLADGKKTATHLGANRLDKERIKMVTVLIVSYGR